MGLPGRPVTQALTTVHVVLAAVPRGAAADSAWTSVLSAADLAVVGRKGFAADRDRSAAGRAGIRWLLAELLGTDPAAIDLRTEGRPAVPGTGWEVSWSHSGQVVALAAAPSLPVGVDVEEVPPEGPPAALAELGLSSVADFVAYEAGLKASGHRLGEPVPAGIVARPLPAPPGHHAAVAAAGEGWTWVPHRPLAGPLASAALAPYGARPWLTT